MSENIEDGGFIEVCAPKGPVQAVTFEKLIEVGARSYFDELVGDLKTHGCALLLMPTGCEQGVAVVGIVPLTPDNEHHAARLETIRDALANPGVTSELVMQAFHAGFTAATDRSDQQDGEMHRKARDRAWDKSFARKKMMGEF